MKLKFLHSKSNIKKDERQTASDKTLALFLLLEVIIFLLLLYFVYRVITYKTFGIAMSLSSIIGNAGNVVNNYLDETIRVIIYNAPVIILLLLVYMINAVLLYRLIIAPGSKKKIGLTVLCVVTFVSFGLVFIPIGRNDIKGTINISNDKSLKKYNNDYNVFDIDFEKLNSKSSDQMLINVNDYVSSLIPSKKNEYTGIFKGKNLILICAEAYSYYVLDPVLTPTLYRLTYNGFRFNDFYVPSWGGSTTSGEYAFLTGLIPCHATESMKQTIGKNMYFTMPRALKRKGYNTGAYHNGNYRYYDRNLTHGENLGFDFFLATGNGIEKVTKSWPIDVEMIEDTFKTYCDNGPFCMYYMTMSGHAFYNDDESYKVIKSIEKVKERHGEKYEKQVMNYICYQMYLEDALTKLVELLTEKNMLDDTVICMVSDHFPYGLNSAAFTDGIDYLPNLYGKGELNELELDRNMPILWSGCLENKYSHFKKDIDAPTSSLDLLPTLLNLFGEDFDSRLLVGRDALSDAEAVVAYNDGALKTSKGAYIPHDMKFHPNVGEEVDSQYVKLVRENAKNKVLYSDYVVTKDYFDYILKNKK